MKSFTPKSHIRVLVFSGFFFPGFKGGGPIKTIKNLFCYTSEEIQFKLVTSDRDLGDKSPYTSVACGEWNKFGKSSVFYAQPGITGYGQIVNILRNQKYDLVYLNSFFSPRLALFPLLLTIILRKKVLLAPRGEFSEGALSLKTLKKNAFITIFKILRLHKNIVFQASSDFEAGDIRRVLGKDVDFYIAENIGSQDFAESLAPRKPDVLKAVFVSRISPKKNLLAALEILSGIGHPIKYDIYGPIEDFEYWQQCEQAIKDLPPHIEVMHKGTLTPDEVVKTLSKYDVFLFPTKGENYGHVIAEALCAALPIVIADTTPWRNLPQKGIGWDLPLNNHDDFRSVLEELATIPPEQHLKMRQHVLAWAKKKFSQRDAIESNIAMFKYTHERK